MDEYFDLTDREKLHVRLQWLLFLHAAHHVTDSNIESQQSYMRDTLDRFSESSDPRSIVEESKTSLSKDCGMRIKMVNEIPPKRWDVTCCYPTPILEGGNLGFTSLNTALEGYLIPLHGSKLKTVNALRVPFQHDITINKPSLLKEMPEEIRDKSESEMKIIVAYFRTSVIRKQILEKNKLLYNRFMDDMIEGRKDLPSACTKYWWPEIQHANLYVEVVNAHKLLFYLDYESL
jgi:hypothetical protein